MTEYSHILATIDQHFLKAKELFLEYAASLDFDLCFQDFDKELEQIREMYNSKDGGIILLFDEDSDDFAGCVAVRRFSEGTAELKRMYIRPSHRGKGLGEELLLKALELARHKGYRRIVLDTVGSMKQAIRLYKKHGFEEIPAYTFNPQEDVLYFEKMLAGC